MKEEIIRLKRHPRSVFFWHMWFVFAGGGSGWVIIKSWGNVEAFLVAFGVLLTVIITWRWTIRWLLEHEWRITDTCIESEHEPWGLFRWIGSSSVISIPLHRVRTIRLIKDPTDRWLGMKDCGRLLIDVLGDAGSEILIPDIPDVANVKAEIERRLPRHYH